MSAADRREMIKKANEFINLKHKSVHKYAKALTSTLRIRPNYARMIANLPLSPHIPLDRLYVTADWTTGENIQFDTLMYTKDSIPFMHLIISFAMGSEFAMRDYWDSPLWKQRKEILIEKIFI